MNTTPNARDYFISSLMDLIKINTENPMNIATVEQLAGAIPQNEFVNFIAFIAKSDNDYKKPIEVIASAVKEFEKLRVNQVKNSGMENEIKALVDKCRYVSNIAYDRKPKGLNFTQWALTANFLNFPNVFTKDEQFLLNEIGGCKRWLISHDDNSFFEDLLETKLNKMINYQHTSSLKYQGTNTILKLLQNGNN